MKDFIKTFIFIVLLSLPVVACGIKPSSVDAPQGEENDSFPRTYPAN
ncbi:MAG: hypothetical protein R3D88_01045 [Alphaproteobacteria bacterium]|nr:hypothetical protein [Alphaproteobacteria bacterium]